MTCRDKATLLILGGVLAAALGAAWVPGRTLFARDLTYLFHPMNVWTAENLQAGRMPLWNPFVSGGVSWLGQPQTGVFYPGNLFFWLFPFVGGLKLFHGAHFFVSALGGYLWARSAGGTRSKALAAGLLWSLNGFWRSRAEFPPLLAALAWTPWMGLLVGRGAVALSLVGGLAVAAGYWPQVVWSGVLVLAAAGARRAAAAWRAVPLAAGLGAAALAPGVDLALRSARAAGGLGAAAGSHAFSPANELGLLWPWASAMKDAAFTGEKFYWLGCFFIGIAGAWIAVRAFLRSPVRARLALGGLFVFGAILVLGEGTPLFPFLRDHVPPFGWVRNPGQFSFWMTGTALVLATIGPGRPRRPFGTLLAAAVGVELLVVGAGMSPTIGAAYFHRAPAWLKTVQAGEGRLFLTPRAVGDMRAVGNSAADAWDHLREKGLSLTTLPYHVRNVNPLGFSLNSAATENLLSDLYGAPSLREAAPLLDRLDARWVASPGPLEGPGLRLAREGPWRLYAREAHPVASDGALRRTSEIWDPGWTAWSGGKRRRTVNDGGLLSIELDRGDPEPRLLFRPRAFRAGLAAAVLSWAALAAWGLGCL
jgi:hypothetical protein